MWMRRSEIAGELVQCVVTDEGAGRHVQHTVLGIKFLNCASSASRITFTEYFRKIAVEQRLDATHIYAHRWRDTILAGMLVHRSTPYLWRDDMVAGSTSETEIIENHRFIFLVYGTMACHGPVAHHRYADTWLTANARTQWPLLPHIRSAACIE
jgi:hypothetical protein